MLSWEAASMSALVPFLFVAFTSAFPLYINALTTSRWLFSAAAMRAVYPYPPCLESTGAPSLSSLMTPAAFPAWAAANNAAPVPEAERSLRYSTVFLLSQRNAHSRAVFFSSPPLKEGSAFPTSMRYFTTSLLSLHAASIKAVVPDFAITLTEALPVSTKCLTTSKWLFSDAVISGVMPYPPCLQSMLAPASSSFFTPARSPLPAQTNSALPDIYVLI
mmetsp:Transcript_2144/g.3044  ORF Transcript_2144/g.3044 Transcript_2144/m.3044 type:complete len:218 (+) Transcript_2144:360-1013(+)